MSKRCARPEPMTGKFSRSIRSALLQLLEPAAERTRGVLAGRRRRLLPRGRALVIGSRLRRSSTRDALDLLQFVVFVGIVLWLLVRGASTMGYNWQWYRVPRYLYRVVDG